MTDHPTPPGAEAEERLDSAEQLFRDVVRGAVTGQLDERITLAFRVFKKEMVNLYGEDVPSNPAPDLARDDGTEFRGFDDDKPAPAPVPLARDDDAQSEVDDEDQPDGIANDSLDLPEPARAAVRVWKFLSEFGDGLVANACDGAPLYARDLEALSNLPGELDRHIGAHRRDNQRHANVAQVLRSELADMTADRDAYREERSEAADAERRAEKAWRDAARRAEAAEAERDAKQDGWKRANDARDDLQGRLETAQVEASKLREELAAVVEQRNRRDRTAGLEESARIVQEVRANNAERERDALQARIEAMQLSVDYAERRAGRYKMAYEQACLDQTQPAPPADDGSEAEARFKFVPDATYGARWEREDWRPRVGEHVIRIGGAHEFHASVVDQLAGGTYYVTHDQADGAESVVTVDKLRPAKEADDA